MSSNGFDKLLGMVYTKTVKFLRLILGLGFLALFIPQVASAHLNGQPYVVVNGKPVGTDLSSNFYAGRIWDLASESYVAGATINFRVDHKVLTDTFTQYRWLWPDGTSTLDSGSGVTHRFATAGTYIVNLQSKGLSDPNYSTTLDTIGVNVLPHAGYRVPTANVTVTQLSVGIVRFTATPILDPSAKLANVLWNFGDSQTSTGTGVVARHTYTNAGDFKLVPAVQIKDSNGLYTDIVFNLQSLDSTFHASTYSGQTGAVIKLTQLPQNKKALLAVGVAAFLAILATFLVVLKTSGRGRKSSPPKPRKPPAKRRG